MRTVICRMVVPGMVAAVFAIAPAFAQDEVVTQTEAPADPETIDVERIFLDTFVNDVLVDDVRTVALMDVSPRSPCASNAYTFMRERPNWLFLTGRLLVAQREPARIRISFSCVGGEQVLNAIQFLEPPRTVSRATPRTNQVVRTNTRTPIVIAPGGAGVAPAERVRQIPLP